MALDVQELCHVGPHPRKHTLKLKAAGAGTRRPRLGSLGVEIGLSPLLDNVRQSHSKEGPGEVAPGS